jgi:hypothetical protein
MQKCLVLCKTLDIFAAFYGQENGHMGNIVDKSLRANSANVIIKHETKPK